MIHHLNLKVYIAGPMTGLPDNNYPAFHKADFDLRNQGHIPLNPALNKAISWLGFMRASLRQIADADCLYMLAGWQTSKGAKIEHQLALDLHLPIFYENELKPANKPATESKFDLQSNEQYRLQMAAIGTASFGYWREGDKIHPDFDTVPLHDVAKLHAKYEALSKKYDALLSQSANVIAAATKEVSPGVKEGWTAAKDEAKLAEKVVRAAYADTDPDHPSTGQDIPKKPERFIVQVLDVFGNWKEFSPALDHKTANQTMEAWDVYIPGLTMRVLPVKQPV